MHLSLNMYHHLSPTIKKYVFNMKLFYYLTLNSKLIEHCKDLITAVLCLLNWVLLLMAV